MKNGIIVFLLSFIFLGCSNIKEKKIVTNKTKHPAYINRYYANTNYKYYLKGNDGRMNSNLKIAERRKAAINYFYYAIMASNTYDDNAYFDLSDKFGYKRIKRYNALNGFSADIYRNEEKKEIVIAFRGSEGIKDYGRDWIFANFTLFFDGQYKSARKLVDKIKANYFAYEIVAVGHSLGGGLAIHSSLYKDGIKAITFNTSPRIFNKSKFEENDNKIYNIAENGEPLKFVGKLFDTVDNIEYKVDSIGYDFMDDLIEHNSYLLTRGILKVAATTERFPEVFSDVGKIGALELMETYVGPETE